MQRTSLERQTRIVTAPLGRSWVLEGSKKGLFTVNLFVLFVFYFTGLYKLYQNYNKLFLMLTRHLFGNVQHLFLIISNSFSTGHLFCICWLFAYPLSKGYNMLVFLCSFRNVPVISHMPVFPPRTLESAYLILEPIPSPPPSQKQYCFYKEGITFMDYVKDI